MIRVAVFLAAIALLPLVALAEVPAAKAPAKRVSDAYYARRQQAKSAAADASGRLTSERPGIERSMQVQEPNEPSLTAAMDIAVGPAARSQAATDAYTAQRQAEAANAMAVTATPTHYVDNPTEYTETEQIAPQEFTDNSCVNGAEEEYPAKTGPMGLGCMMAAVQAVPTSNVLWNEIYSCRSMWVNFDYLGFWVKGNHVPALVTTSPIGTPQNQAGVLGQPGTSILFGDQRVNNDLRSGGRITAGAWLVGDVLGIEGNYYALGTATTNFSAASTFSAGASNDPILARPYFNPAPPILSPPPPHAALPPAQSATLLAYPNFIFPGVGTINLDGTVHVTTSSTVQSAGVLLQRLVGVDLAKDHRMFLVGGYRWFRMEEGLLITDTINTVGGGLPAGAGFTHLDSFGTKNSFNGGDVGLQSDLRRGRWLLATQGKLAIGDMHEIVNIDGQTKVNNGTTIVGFPGGILTQASNMGVYRRDQLALIPELNVKLGFQITPGWRATAGYNFTYISRVARPGNEVDLVVNPPYTPGAQQVVARPQYLNNPTDLWLQGVTAGFEYHW
jgi:hypothetical protein